MFILSFLHSLVLLDLLLFHPFLLLQSGSWRGPMQWTGEYVRISDGGGSQLGFTGGKLHLLASRFGCYMWCVRGG